MAGIDLSPVLRGLAALSDLRLGLANSVGIFPSVLLLTWAETHTGNPWLTVGAALMALVAVSLLIGVISFYRDDDLVLSGVLLAAITGIGTGGSMIVSVAIVHRISRRGGFSCGRRLLRSSHAADPSDTHHGGCCVGRSEVPPVSGP